MADFEVHLSVEEGTRQIGRARSNRARGKETVVFEYAEDWLRHVDRFALEPELPLTRGGFAPPVGHAIELKDRFDCGVEPKEWFLAPLPVIREIIQRLMDGTIENCRYDPESAQVVVD